MKSTASPNISFIFKQTLFWVGIFLYFILTSDLQYYGGGYPHLIDSVLKIVVLQMITAYVCINFLIPKFLNKKKNIEFLLGLILLLTAMFALYNLANIYWYQPKYILHYSEAALEYADDSFLQRMMRFDIMLSKFIKFLTPTALLVLFRFYKNQQQFLQLKEQKKSAELSALKNQLNPHFLFNTLNNLYALTLEKSDRAPEVIERLSDILDYLLYRCKETYVPISKEVELIENYLSLEKVRYGKRVVINFEDSAKSDLKIAPLILLTFIENAFKHGVSQELTEATIDIRLSNEGEHIDFFIANSMPKIKQSVETKKEALGLKNVRQQLELLYPNAYQLDMKSEKDIYQVSLKLTPQQDV